MLHATAGTHSPSSAILKTYWAALQDLPVADIERAMLAAIKEDDRHVTPANLRARVHPTTSYQKSTHAAIVAERKQQAVPAVIHEPSEIELMLADACWAFARRIGGGSLGAHMMPKTESYKGSFEYMPIVNAARLPDSTDMEEHRRAFAELRVILREEWQFQSTAKTPPGGV